MPELPEVQTIVNDLAETGILHQVVSSVQVAWDKTIAGLDKKKFGRKIRGHHFTSIHRRGKYIVLGLSSGDTLLIHLRMTGRLYVTDANSPRLKHEHVIIGFGDQAALRFHDTRKFGRMYLTANADKVIGHLGPEPLDACFTPDKFFQMLAARKKMIKPLLLDQSFIAGLGNIYADEALWTAGIHPERQAHTLSETESRSLHKAIGAVLRLGLENFGTTLGGGQANFLYNGRRKGRNWDYLKVFRQTDLPCPRCRQPIERIVVGQRSTHICRECQKR